MFRAKSFWERLLEIAGNEKVSYHGYSYGRRADIYRFDLNNDNVLQITDAVKRLAPRSLQAIIRVVQESASILFVCPRSGNVPPH